MSAPSRQGLPTGHAVFARYAFPPNELGYCGPADADVLLRGDDPAKVAAHAQAFDGAWPYLRTIADAAGVEDALDPNVVQSYWIGGELLDRVDPETLLRRLRTAFAGQVTGLLSETDGVTGALAHHSFHVFVVYPWVRFLDRDAETALRVMQNCRIRSGTVTAVDDEHVVMTSRPLALTDEGLALGEPRSERVRWSRAGASFVAAPTPGDTVSAHWDWVCAVLSGPEDTALDRATRSTLSLVNIIRQKGIRP